jgi:general secretion pathway protein E/type IV pilus assembly protein PilB
VEYTPDPADVPSDFPKVEGELKLFKGAGCRSCRNSGYRGRVGLYELLVATDTIRELVIQRTNAMAIRNVALKEGMITLRMDGFRKVLSGKTTIEEVARVTAGDIMG